MMESDLPRWVALVLGSVSFLMGALIVAALGGWVPMEGQLLAPVWIVGSVGGIFALFGLLLMIPESAWQPLRAILGLGVIGLVAVICNWSGFAPEVSYSSSGSLSFGPLSIGGQIGGARVVFVLAALVVDAFLLYGVAHWLWSLRQDD